MQRPRCSECRADWFPVRPCGRWWSTIFALASAPIRLRVHSNSWLWRWIPSTLACGHLSGHLRHATRRVAHRGDCAAASRPPQTPSACARPRPTRADSQHGARLPAPYRDRRTVHPRPLGGETPSRASTTVPPSVRCTLFTVLAKMNGTGAEAAVDGFTRVLDRVEAQKRLSITYDAARRWSCTRP